MFLTVASLFLASLSRSIAANLKVMKYWLDLFTGTTWEEFRKSGAMVSGFSERMRNNVERMAPGDVRLCYLTGVMRWVGALEVLGPSQDNKRIWKDAEFPARVAVKPSVMLSPENGVSPASERTD